MDFLLVLRQTRLLVLLIQEMQILCHYLHSKTEYNSTPQACCSFLFVYFLLSMRNITNKFYKSTLQIIPIQSYVARHLLISTFSTSLSNQRGNFYKTLLQTMLQTLLQMCYGNSAQDDQFPTLTQSQDCLMILEFLYSTNESSRSAIMNSQLMQLCSHKVFKLSLQ